MMMPIKQKSKRFEFEYISPDEDIFIITFVENEGRKYIQIKSENQDNKEAVIYDLEMLYDIVDELRRSISQSAAVATGPQIPTPNVIDHRSNKIQDSVAESMKNADSDTQAIESFSTNDENISEKGELKKWGKSREVSSDDKSVVRRKLDASNLI
jgi:hypothetical protein